MKKANLVNKMIKKKEKKMFQNSLCCAAQKYYPNNKFTNSKTKENLTQSTNFTKNKNKKIKTHPYKNLNQN